MSAAIVLSVDQLPRFPCFRCTWKPVSSDALSSQCSFTEVGVSTDAFRLLGAVGGLSVTVLVEGGTRKALFTRKRFEPAVITTSHVVTRLVVRVPGVTPLSHTSTGRLEFTVL